jgi:hypothetical protein
MWHALDVPSVAVESGTHSVILMIFSAIARRQIDDLQLHWLTRNTPQKFFNKALLIRLEFPYGVLPTKCPRVIRPLASVQT